MYGGVFKDILYPWSRGSEMRISIDSSLSKTIITPPSYATIQYLLVPVYISYKCIGANDKILDQLFFLSSVPTTPVMHSLAVVNQVLHQNH